MADTPVGYAMTNYKQLLAVLNGQAEDARPRVVVVGSSGHARVVIDVLESQGIFCIAGLVDSYKPTGTKLRQYQILGNENDLTGLVREGVCDAVLVAVGDNWTRGQITRYIREILPEISFATAIHPSAQIARGVVVGVGTVIMPGVVVNTGCQIGDGCILNTCSSLDHDSRMDDFSSLAPRAVTGGNVSIGTYSAVAIGAVVSHGISIGEHTVIGSGATVLRNVPARVVAYGVPAKIIRPREPGDSYLGERSYDELRPPASPRHFDTVNSSMAMRIIRVDSPEWNAYVTRTTHDMYHTAEYHQVAERLGGGDAVLFVCGNEDKFVAWPSLIREIDPGTKKLKDISSAYGYTGPVVHGCAQDPEFLRAAWHRFREIWQAHGVVSVFTRFHPLLGNERYVPYLRDDSVHPEFNHETYAEGATVAIDLASTADEILHSYSRTHRSSLKKLENVGMRATSDPEWAHLDTFVRLYHDTMRRNDAAEFYFFSESYFRRLQEALGSHGSLMMVSIEDTITAGGLLIEYGGIVNLHLLATDDRFLALSPSKLVVHAAQVWARERGNRFLHLGGGRGSRTDDSLFQFKSYFSDKSYPFYTGRWVLNREVYDALTVQSLQNGKLALSNESAESFFPAYRMRA